ncbi:methylglyoxal synthase [Acetobacterium sp. KB-1]|jgi:methylglyoxal synthase|nr:methylglyoxal synthase [Acetobacterium sp. KB-1]
MRAEMEYVNVTIEKTKKIALIAHDGKKAELLDWACRNKEILQRHHLCGTGTTGSLIQEQTGLPVQIFKSGPFGGDQQIGARIVDGKIDMLIFIWDPLEAQPHDPDIKALLRIATVYDIPVANNLATADFIIHSRFMNEEYVHPIEDQVKKMKNRLVSVLK